MADDLAIQVAAVLEEFTAAQRAQAIGQARMQKVTYLRTIGEAQVHFEAVIEQDASPEDTFELVARWDMAGDRLRAKVELSGHYGRLLNLAGQIEMSMKALAEDSVRFDAENVEASQGRRVVVRRTGQQLAALKQHRDGIRDGWQRIEETQRAIDEAKRILDGADPFVVLAEQINARLDQLRGSRAAA